MSTLFVSIIVPAYNAHDTMSLCIESLLALDYPKDSYEIIIVDNNSTDDTAKIIKQYPVTYLLEDQVQTAYASRNRGIKHAKGEIIALTDSDCIADPNWLKAGVSLFSDQKIGALGGKILSYQPDTWLEQYQDRINKFDHSDFVTEEKIKQKTAKIVTGNAFYRKSVFDKAGLFDSNLRGGGDRDISYRIQRKTDYTLTYNPEAVVYHKHKTNLRGLWEQISRYGYSNLFLYCRYCPEAVDKWKDYKFIKLFYWKFRAFLMSQIKSVSLTIKYCILYLVSLKKENKLKLIDNFIAIIEHTAFFYGQLKAARSNNLPFIFTDDNVK